MKKFNINLVTLALGLAFSAGAIAQGISKDEYKAGKNQIKATYTAAKEQCAAFAGNAKDICVAEAKGKEKLSKAELEERYSPTPKMHHKMLVAKAEAEYDVAKERCDDKDGNLKDVCVKEAKAALTTAKANAKLQEKTVDARDTASEKTSDARKDAAGDKRDANFAVAKEKCEAFSNETKDRCLADAKAKYGK